LAVDFFRKAGADVQVVLPDDYLNNDVVQTRDGKTITIVERELLDDIDSSRLVMRVPCGNPLFRVHDDNLLLSAAKEKGGCVLSLDLFRKEVTETPAFMATIARSLKYHFSREGKFHLSRDGLDNLYIQA